MKKAVNLAKSRHVSFENRLLMGRSRRKTAGNDPVMNSQKMIVWGIFGVQPRVCTGEGAGVGACSVGGYRDRGHPAPAAGPT